MTRATGFDAIVGQHEPIRLLRTFVHNGKLPHALLFTGDEGIGKKTTALAFAMACNCRTLKAALPDAPPLAAVDACGTCVPCKKIAGGRHPDLIHVAPAPTVIKIARIRELLQTLALKPNEADRRLVLISDAHTMNPEAANALLKVLEEPPRRTLLVLTAPQPGDLLPTVASRCRHIRFAPLTTAEIGRLLTAAGDVDPASVASLSLLSGGSYTRARRRLDGKWSARRNWMIALLEKLIAPSSGADLRTWLAFSEQLAGKKDQVEESLETITLWLRDVLVAGCDPQKVMDQDRLRALTRTAAQAAPARLLACIEAVNAAKTALRSNTNVRLTLDAMVLRMAQAGV
jgi:DNA polymerase-3 subunit delta'